MGNPPSEPTFLWEGGLLEGKDEVVEVNQRALIDKVLARYSAPFVVFRELLQNSDDAQSTTVEIYFETREFAKNKQRESSSDHSDENLPDLKTAPVHKWTVRNNGIVFRSEDWARLKKIADGNPDPERIGAFGVGFYSLFSVTEDPFVTSGEQWMGFYWKDKKDQLFVRRGQLPHKDSWTSFSMPLREDAPMPVAFDLARFLASSVTFMSYLSQVEVYFNDKRLLKITKSKGLPQELGIPKGLRSTSPSGAMTVTAIKSLPLNIKVELMAWVYTSGSEKPPPPSSIQKSKPASTSFFSSILSSFAGASTPQRVATPLPPEPLPPVDLHKVTENNVTLSIYTAEVDVRLDKKVASELLRSTKKDAPRKIRYELIYTGKDEYDASKSEDESFPSGTGSIFQTLRADLDGTGTARVFIGHSTAQTTGLGGHMSARFITTVERDAIDFMDRNVSIWNKELLFIGGFLARTVYEFELANINTLWEEASSMLTQPNEEFQTSLRKRIIHIFKFFTFHQSTPLSEVSSFMEEAFFSCGTKPLPLLSTVGIRNVNEVRMPDPTFTEFLKQLPVLPDDVVTEARPMITTLQSRQLIKPITFVDVLRELKSRPLTEMEMIACLTWWCSLHKQGANQRLLSVRAELLNAAVLTVGEPGTKDERIIPLHTIKTFINIRGPPGALIPLQGPLPDDLIPPSISKQFNPDQLTVSLPWTELLIYDWLQHICSPRVCSSNPAYDINVSATWAELILNVLVRAWPSLSNDSRESIQTLLKSRTCIPTSGGMKTPQEAYFAQANIFHDLPVVTPPSGAHIKAPMERVLQSLGVRRHVELQLVFDRMIKTNEWTLAELVKYLVSVQSTLTKEEWQRLRMTPFFFKEPIKSDGSDATKPRRYPAKQLYEPSKTLRDMNLPLIDWGVQHKWKPASDEAKFLFELGLMRYPSLDVLIKLCGSSDTALRNVAFKYLVDNLPVKYSEYEPMQFADIAFIPALINGHASIGTPKEVFSAPQWSVFGLAVVAPTLTPDIVSKLKIRQHPPSALLISLLEKTPPKSESEATEWFSILAGQISTFSQSDLNRISHFQIVPVQDKGTLKHFPPNQCFFGTDAKTTFHSKLFLFVDFGIAANSFLNACGTKQEPSIEEIVHILLSNPRKFFELAGGPVSFLNELRNIAMNYKLLSSGTIVRMKRAPILLGSQRKTSGEELDDEEEWDLQYDLRLPEDIVIADDTVALQFFGHALFTAPQEDQLEAFYMQLGSRRLSSLVKEDFSTSAEIKDHKSASDTRALILERLPLFLHEHTHAKTRVSYTWLNNPANFIVKTYGKISVTKRLIFGTTKLEETQETSAVAKRFSYGPVQLWIAGNSQVDMYEVATTLNRLIFESPKASDTLLFMTLLSTDLRSLKRRGYNVDRILRQQKANREAAQAEEAARIKAQNVKLMPKHEFPEPATPPPIPPKPVTSVITGPPPAYTSESERDTKPGKHGSVLKSWKNLKHKFGESIGSNFHPSNGDGGSYHAVQAQSQIEDGPSPSLSDYGHHSIGAGSATSGKQGIGALEAGSATSGHQSIETSETGSATSGHQSLGTSGVGTMTSGHQSLRTPGAGLATPGHQSIGNSRAGSATSGHQSLGAGFATSATSEHQSIGTSGAESAISGQVKETVSEEKGRVISVPSERPGLPHHGVTPLSNISTNIDMAIMACRPEHENLLRNTEEMQQVQELLNEGYCDISGQVGSLTYVGAIGDTKIYVGEDVRETQTFVTQHKESLRRFVAIMNTLSRIYGLPNTNLHVFYDLESHLIGFNRNGSIFFNLRYWEAWHDDDASKRNVAPALISWYFTLAHEIAHNLVQPHNSEHEFYFSAISEKFIMQLVKVLQ